MSLRYKGARISATPPTTTGGESGVASGAWTLEQQFQAQGAGNWPEPAPDPSLFIENLFSTYLYTGNGSTGQSIVNNIDLSGKGGMVWAKARSAATDNALFDTARGAGEYLSSNRTDAQFSSSGVIAFNADGFNVGGSTSVNGNGVSLVSWTFRKQPKFFDVVTATVTGSQAVFNHNLGSTPGCVFVKSTSNTDDWAVWHRSFSNTTNNYLLLNSTAAVASAPNVWDVNSTSVTINYRSAGTYVAYVFAHDAGGFGLTGTDNVISCGSFTGSYGSVNLGYEPQWLLVKQTNSANSWRVFDNMRGWTVGPTKSTGNAILIANTSAAETDGAGYWGTPTATGFDFDTGGGDYIYIAIRRGPMKVPTDATKVFSPVAYTGTGATRTITAGFPVDLAIPKLRNAATNGAEWYTRLIGPNIALLSAYTFGELARPNELTSFASNTGVVLGDSSTSGGTNASGSTYVDWNFGRAPSFFDEVCYTGTGTAGQTYTHNLGVAPELMIVKNRTTASQWLIYQNSLGNTQYLLFTTAASASGSFAWNNTSPTSSVFSVGTSGACNTSGENYVAYLFATCAGVSKVGSYTGTGTTLQINCGFTAGARFVLIKRTDDVGDWYVWDSARGIVSGNDPYLLLNSTAAEVTSTDYVDTYSAGFEISSTAPAAINASGGTFIFLAIA